MTHPIRPSLCAILSLLALGSVQPALAQSSLLVGWDFAPTDTKWFAGLVDRTGDFVGDGSVDSNFSDLERTGTIFWDGQFGSTAFNYTGFGAQVTTFDGTPSVNQAIASRPADQHFTTDTLDPNALGFNGVNGSFVLRLNTTGYGGLRLSYAGQQQGDGSGAANTIAWSWSTNGVNFTDVGDTDTIAVGSYTLQQVNLTAISGLDNQATAYLRGTLAGSPGPVQFNSIVALDNIQVTGAPIPEPAHGAALLALLAILGQIWRRRS